MEVEPEEQVIKLKSEIGIIQIITRMLDRCFSLNIGYNHIKFFFIAVFQMIKPRFWEEKKCPKSHQEQKVGF